MKIFIVLLLIAIVLWLISLAWKYRRNANGDGGSTGGSSDTDMGYTSSHCSHDSGSCDGGGDGGGGGD
ncbi:MAG: hypothetical protein Q8L69_13135 [Gallionellaceae bacterium]|nr:hypothetical protein [Gallionellaceae bacterium]